MTAQHHGWYPDPGGVAQLRWWDGFQWTHDVAPLPPPAFAPPLAGGPATGPGPVAPATPIPVDGPPVPAPAISPGDAMPGTVLFDEMIGGAGPLPRRRLWITPEQLIWGKDTRTMTEVEGVAFWAVKQSVNGLPAGTERFFVLSMPGATWKMSLPSFKGSPAKKNNEGYFDRLVEISEHLIEPRLCSAALSTIEAGGSYEVAKVTFDRAGIRSEALLAKQTIPWSAVEEVGLARGQVVISQGARGKPISIALKERNAMVAARLVARAADRLA